MNATLSAPVLVRIVNEPRDYDWGSAHGIPNLTGHASTGGPLAELWLGAHPGSPALLDDGTPLHEFLAARGLAQPGILLKVLSAAKPLSLQAHPTPEQAQIGFERENAAGVPLDAPHRSYKDARAKPEMLVAVTEFQALSGFRSVAESRAVVEALAAIDARVRVLLEHLDDPAAAFAWLLAEGDEQRGVVAGVVAAAPQLDATFALDADTVARLASAAPGDPGIVISLLLHRLSLQPGEGLALPAGNLHAYLEGTGIELMEASDNVLRGGLTSKHVDIPELLEVVDATPIAAPVLHPEVGPTATAYSSALPFSLQHVHESGCVASAASAIVLALAPTTVEVDGEQLALERGQGAFAMGATVTVTSPNAWLAADHADTPMAS